MKVVKELAPVIEVHNSVNTATTIYMANEDRQLQAVNHPLNFLNQRIKVRFSKNYINEQNDNDL